MPTRVPLLGDKKEHREKRTKGWQKETDYKLKAKKPSAY